MKWTLNTYEVAQEWELDHLISMCQQTGYPYIEFLMDFDQPHSLEWDTPAERFQEVKQKLDEAGLKYGSLTSCQTFHSPDAAERTESVNRVKRVIDRAREIGCDHVRVLGDNAVPCDAIVEEHFPPEAMASDHAFYATGGDQALLQTHMQAMMDSVARFIDFEHIDVIPMSEYLIKELGS